jgi:hypothetical protein
VDEDFPTFSRKISVIGVFSMVPCKSPLKRDGVTEWNQLDQYSIIIYRQL